jgi:hypothetical protein
MTIKLCIVAPFKSKGYFQWYITLEKYASKLGIELSEVSVETVYFRIHSDFSHDPYWNPIREADCVFVYATRRDDSNWWELPKFVRYFMKAEAKMIAQYDDEFMWLFDSKQVWWRISNPDNHGGPEQFFRDTGILEYPDAHLTVTSKSEFRKYTTKPVFKMLLPQLCRYKLGKYSEKHQKQNIAIMLHSTISASSHNTLENVIKPKNYAVTVFSNFRNQDDTIAFRGKEKLPVNSEILSKMEYEPYVDLLWRNCNIGLDDNIGYLGWSRFGLECAVAYIPCVGSTEAVQDLFPELYTAPQDYAKQIELIERLRTDKKFYHEMAQLGQKRLVEMFDEEKMCRELLDIFSKIEIVKRPVMFVPNQPKPIEKPKSDKQNNHPHP